MLTLFPALLVVLLRAASPSPTAAGPQGELYRDPDGRFTVAVPAGWKASPQGDGIKIARGSAYAWISPFEGASSASQVVTMLAGQFAGQWKEFDEVDRGKHTLSGQPARFAVYSGVNPAGVASRLRIAGVVWQQEPWALVLSAPEQEYVAAQSALEGIEKSFTRVEPGARRSGEQDGVPPDPPAAGQRAVLGVALRDLEPGEAQRLGLERPVGVVVGDVMPDGPSDAAGIRADDVIVSVDGQATEHPADVAKVCNAHRPGDEVEVVFLRRGKRKSTRVSLIAAPDSGPPPDARAERGKTGGAPGGTSGRPGGGQGTSGRTGSDQGSPPYYRMKLAQLIDRQGFAEPVEAARLLIPSDWRWEGGIHWNSNATCSTDVVVLEARATSPDGLWAIEFFSPRAWQWTDDPAMQQMGQMQGASGCPMGPAVGAADFIQQNVGRVRPKARSVRAEPLPEVAQAQQRAGEEQLALQFQSGMATGYRVDAARVLFSYAIDGKPVEEWISATVKTLGLRATSATAAMNGQIAYTQSYNILADDLIAIRAPAGQVDKQGKLFATIVGSIRKNQRYLAALQQVFSNVGQAQLKGARDRSRIWTQYANETNEIITRSYENQQNVQDRLAQQYSDSFRGVETFIDPRTREPIELSGGFDQAWVNNRGEYLLSSEPGFDPAVTLQEDWIELQRPRR